MKHLFALAVWLLPCTLCAYTFRGNVASENGKGLEFANIAVSHSADSTFFTVSLPTAWGILSLICRPGAIRLNSCV